MGKEILFRSGDGREFSCNEGSAAFELMRKDGSFTRVLSGDEEAAQTAKGKTDGDDEKTVKPLSKMNRVELVAEAEQREIEVPEDWKKAQIIAAIEEKDGESESTEDDQ